MKKHFLSWCAVLLFCATLSAQEKDTIITLPEIRIATSTAVSENVSKSFKKAFPGAEQLVWYKYDQNYLAKFIMKDMDHNSLFRKSGVMIYDISYGYEKHLPSEISKMVNFVYDNYKIIRSINIKTEGRDIWVVKLEGLKKYATVRIEDGEMDEVERFDKATSD